MNRLANAMMDEGKDLMKSITDEAEAAGLEDAGSQKIRKVRGMYVNPDIKEDLYWRTSIVRRRTKLAEATCWRRWNDC